MDFPLLWALRISSFSWFFYQQEKASLGTLLSAVSCTSSFCAAFWVKASWLWKVKKQIQDMREGRTLGDSSLVWWYLGFWSSSPVLLLPFTFQSLQIALNAFRMRFIVGFSERDKIKCAYSILYRTRPSYCYF